MNRFSSKFSILVFLVAFFCLSSFQGLDAQMKRYRVGYKDQGFSAIIEGSVLLPSNTYTIAYNTHAIFGAQIGANMFVGGGVGLDSYGSNVLIPVFADFRYFFIEDQFTPFVYLDAGYALPGDIDEELKTGPLVAPGFGIKYFLSNTTAINVSLGYRYQSMPYKVVDPMASVALQTNYIHGFAFRLGLQF